jgi:multidrug efflux pump subunit AcrA (membrane-fusion protein)
MRDEKLISDSAFDQAEAEYKMKTAAVESARRRVAQLQAALDSTRDDLIKTTVISPMDGVVTNLPKEAGEMVIGAMSFNPTVIMTVADLSVMECEVMVDETDFRNLKLGQEAKIKVDALEGLELKGDVTEIGSSALVRGSGSQSAAQATLGANTGNQPKDFKVTITIKDPPPNLRPGLNATADITTAKREKVLAVPVQAVVVREVNKEGKVVDPDAMGGGEPGREGNTVYVSKIPYMARQFLAESDPTLKRYYACHCPWARAAIKSGETRLNAVFCNCSGGFHKKPWEVIFGQPLEVEVLASVLAGDTRCRFAIHLPEKLEICLDKTSEI